MLSRVVPTAAVVLAVSLLASLASAGPGDAAWPGDNGRILYSDSGIWVMDGDGGNREQLTTETDVYASWSPDASKIVFERGNVVWTMNPDGTDQQMIAPGRTPSWSQDGSRIVFSRDGHIMEMDADGGNEETLTDDENVIDLFPVHQPGGDNIAFVRRVVDGDAGSPGTGSIVDADEVYIMGPGGALQNVSQTPGYFDGPPDWSPDGTKLVFRSSGSHIYTWTLGSPDPPQVILESDGDVLRGPTWSPDGTRIAFSKGDPISGFRLDETQPQGTPPEFLHIWTMNADGSDPQMLPGSPGPDPVETLPDWGVPSPTPGTDLIQGDNDCDGDVDAVDALQALRFVAGFIPNQQPDCPDLGSGIAAAPAGEFGALFGDVDCDGDVDAVDALQVLRHVAGLSTNQGPGCTEIGQPL